jgi:predicted AlkP superfamily phosphohydrolase/phosphomutase
MFKKYFSIILFSSTAYNLVLLTGKNAFAYIGPGAGIAVGVSLFAIVVAVVSSLLALVFWPLRYLWRRLRGRNAYKKAQFEKVVILGFDGMDFGLTAKMLEEGRLPNFAQLRDQGCFKSLATTLPAISPVAWSSFQTGVNPGKHNIFDFLSPQRKSGAPKLSSVDMLPPRRRIKLGKIGIPIGRADIRLNRKSIPFWKILGDYGIFSNIIRVPITFPPEKFFGALLSAMCAPDLRGTQGTFSFFTSRTEFMDNDTIGGETYPLKSTHKGFIGHLQGPENPFLNDGSLLTSAFNIRIVDSRSIDFETSDDSQHLVIGRFSDWVTITFICIPGVHISGICQVLLKSVEPDITLYVSPIHINPKKPIMPISHPGIYAPYLAKKHGPYATLGLAEDTWALNAGILDDQNFLDQCLVFETERERMLFDALNNMQKGLCVCVFDGTDRIQHTFWRQIDPQHPIHEGRFQPAETSMIASMYERADGILGRVMAKCRHDQALLMVMSDHGFCSFQYGVDLNRWLEENGYLCLENDGRDKKNLTGIRWSETKAFALGLAGIYINTKGRTLNGVVAPGAETDRLAEEIAEKLSRLHDGERNRPVIKNAYVARTIYRGPYVRNAPDVIAGYQSGYRASWETAVGQVTARVLHANRKAWSGDHCVDPSIVPGVLFCNHAIDDDRLKITDIAPTVLDNFGVSVPTHMDGKVMKVKKGKPWRIINHCQIMQCFPVA